MRELIPLVFFVLFTVILSAGCIQESNTYYDNPYPVDVSVDIYYKYQWQGAINDGTSSYSISGMGSKSNIVPSLRVISVSVQKMDGSSEPIKLCIDDKCQSSTAPYGVVTNSKMVENSKEKIDGSIKNNPLKEKIKSADLLFDQGKYEESIIKYNEIITINPSLEDIFNNKAIALAEVGKYQESIQAIEKAIQIAPEKPKQWLHKAIILDKMGKYQEAIQACDNEIKINPNYADTWNEKGYALLNLGKYQEVIQFCDKAIQIGPEKDKYWLNKGSSLYYLGRYKESLQAIDKAIQLNPQNPLCWNNKGAVLDKLGKIQEANKAYAQGQSLGNQ